MAACAWPGRCRVGGRFLAKSCNLNVSFFYFRRFFRIFWKWESQKMMPSPKYSPYTSIYFHILPILPYTSIYFHILSIYFPYVLPYSHTPILPFHKTSIKWMPQHHTSLLLSHARRSSTDRRSSIIDSIEYWYPSPYRYYFASNINNIHRFDIDTTSHRISIISIISIASISILLRIFSRSSTTLRTLPLP